MLQSTEPAAPTAQTSTSTRVSIDKGIVMLRCPGIPSVACALRDLDDQGCRCDAPFYKLDEVTTQRWMTYIHVGRRLSINISAPPRLQAIHLDAEVAQIEDSAGTKILHLAYRTVEPSDREALTRALAAPSLAAPAADALPLNHSGTFAALPATETKTFIAPVAVSAPKPEKTTPPPRPAQAPAPSPFFRATVPTPVPPPKNDPYRARPIGEILLALGRISEAQLADSLSAMRNDGERLGQFMVRSGWMTPADLCSALALQCGLPVVDLSEQTITPRLAEGLSLLAMLRHEFVPFGENTHAVKIAASQPLKPWVVTDLENRLKKRVLIYLAEEEQIRQSLAGLQPAKARRQRRYARHACEIPVAFRPASQHPGLDCHSIFTGRTGNVSEGGFLLYAREDMRRRGACLAISLDVAPYRIEGMCSIRHARQSAHGDFGWELGIQIIDMPSQSRAQLKELCGRISAWESRERKRGQN